MRGFTQRVLLMMIIDAILISLALPFALLIGLDGNITPEYIHAMFSLVPLLTIVTLGFLKAFKLYDRLWEYASWGELLSIIKAATLSILLTDAIGILFRLPLLPGSVYILYWGMIICGIGIPRLWWRIFRDYYSRYRNEGTRVLVVGAGAAGAALVREIQSNASLGLEVVAFVDDDPAKRGKMIMGLPIKGNRNDIPELVNELEIMEIIIAMPSVVGAGIREIVRVCEETPARLRILPPIYKNNRGSLISRVRRLNMEDLLGRKPVQIDMLKICDYIQGKTVLVTGGGGSIGSELCRQIVNINPKLLVILDNCENNLFDIEMELNDAGYGSQIAVALIDVKHGYNLEEIFEKYHPQVVFHAAAYKHVPMMERYPEEAMWNNVVGTLNAAQMADKFGSETFVLISTDKAVNPTSIMGATKRLAELVIKDFNWASNTRFAVVRFGNVLGSRGSVIPIFEKQIKRGGPVTVTHPEMKRYFMTIPEAVGLVIQTGAMASGGEIFVLDMGEPVKIADLAENLIKLCGYKPGRDIEIVYTGIRPGEKLFEELFYDKEEMILTGHKRIFISSKEVDKNYLGLHTNIIEMIKKAGSDKIAIMNLISSILPEYHNIPIKHIQDNTGISVAYIENTTQKMERGEPVVVH